MPEATLPAFARDDFETGQPLVGYVRDLATHQPDFKLLLDESVFPSTMVQRLQHSRVRFAALITEPWCPDSLHTVPLLVRMEEAVPELVIRVWLRSEHADLALRIAGEPPGGKPPSVPHVVFYDGQFRESGHFSERPAAVTAWLDEQSRHFRTHLRMREREHVRTETLAGLLAAAEELPAPGRPMDGRQLTIYEHWEAVDPAQRKKLEEVLRRHLPALNAIPGVRSVEFAELRMQPGRYLALFRYADEGVRSAFLRSEPVQRLRAEAEPLWTRVSESVWSYGV